jgi:hypothetical protein
LPTILADELADQADTFDRMIARLNRLSVSKRFDAYADIDWDDPDHAVRADDERFELPADDPLAATAWYRGLPPAQRAEVGLYRMAACMKIGWHFENLLQRGLLAYAMRLPNGAPEFRYLNHEIIEEGQHTLMFQEFVNRSGLPVRGMSRVQRALAQLGVVGLATRFPTLFFVLVLGGEEPVDHLQRQTLREGLRHPLLERIMRIHVTEEARHVSFAHHLLRRDVPPLGTIRRGVLVAVAPVVWAVMARMMVQPPSDLRRHTGLPAAVQWRAFRTPAARRLLTESVAKPRALWQELGLVPGWARPLWRSLGIWA